MYSSPTCLPRSLGPELAEPKPKSLQSRATAISKAGKDSSDDVIDIRPAPSWPSCAVNAVDNDDVEEVVDIKHGYQPETFLNTPLPGLSPRRTDSIEQVRRSQTAPISASHAERIQAAKAAFVRKSVSAPGSTTSLGKPVSPRRPVSHGWQAHGSTAIVNKYFRPDGSPAEVNAWPRQYTRQYTFGPYGKDDVVAFAPHWSASNQQQGSGLPTLLPPPGAAWVAPLQQSSGADYGMASMRVDPGTATCLPLHVLQEQRQQALQQHVLHQQCEELRLMELKRQQRRRERENEAAEAVCCARYAGGICLASFAGIAFVGLTMLLTMVAASP